MKRIGLRRAVYAVLAAVWLALILLAWFSPEKQISESERRPLASMPALSAKPILDGSFMSDFETYSLDQFPFRDGFRQIKSLFHFYVLQQPDNNSIYLADGAAVKQEYPMNRDSVEHALERFEHLYNQYLRENAAKIVMAVIPDKGYYLAEDSGHLSMDYDAFLAAFREGMPWAQHVDLTGVLTAQDYYRTDIHWRQEKLLKAAGALCQALNVAAPEEENYTAVPLERPFYGVYYGQAALPMEPDTMYLMESDLMSQYRVYDYETGRYTSVYDMDKLESRDLYDVFLSGPRSLLTVENPLGDPGRELIVFRDSFGSAMVPLLLEGYGKVTLVDIRYIQLNMLERFLTFDGQDVLLLYSVPVLNNSQTIK